MYLVLAYSKWYYNVVHYINIALASGNRCIKSQLNIILKYDLKARGQKVLEYKSS